MSVVINLRGTGGSGKSTVVRRVMALFPVRLPVMAAYTRKQPAGYLCGRGTGPGNEQPLYIPGHYETACGGCDTIKTVDEVYEMVNQYAADSNDVLYEGIMVQDDVRRAVELDKRLKADYGCNGEQCPVCQDDPLGCHAKDPTMTPGLHVIGLTTPLADCLAAIRARREAAGNEKPLNPKNTTGRFNSQKNIQARLKDAGVALERLDREAAFLRACALLRLDPGASLS